MEDHNAPAIDPTQETTPEGATATESVAGKTKGKRAVYADQAARDEAAARTTNQTINAVISPAFYMHIVDWKYASDPKYRSVDEASKRAILKDGSVSELIRDGLALLTSFTGKQVIETTTTSKVAKEAMEILRGSSAGVFIMARDNMRMYNVPEAQAKEQAIAILKMSQANLSADLVLTPEIIEQLWIESAGPVPTPV